jgi:hypothetical protein
MVTADSVYGDFSAFRGRFDMARALEHLEDCDECAEAARLEHRGWEYLAWGDGFSPAQSADEQFSLEDLSRLALREGYAVHAAGTDELHAVLDAREGGGSLADYEPFALLAAELDRLGSVDATLIDSSQDPATWTAENILGSGDFDEFADAFSLDAMTVLRPYVALGFGSGVEEDGRPFHAVALAHESSAVARENAERMRQRFDEWIARGFFEEMSAPLAPFSVDAYTEAAIEVEERIVTVRLYGDLGRSFPMQTTPLFLHEPR